MKAIYSILSPEIDKSQTIYSFDKIKKNYALLLLRIIFSKQSIAPTQIKDGRIVLSGGIFKSWIVPVFEKILLPTLEKLIALKKAGAKIIFERLLSSVLGFNEYEAQNKKSSACIAKNKKDFEPVSNVFKALEKTNTSHETLINSGLKYIRREIDREKIYYLVNHTSKVNDSILQKFRYRFLKKNLLHPFIFYKNKEDSLSFGILITTNFCSLNKQNI